MAFLFGLQPKVPRCSSGCGGTRPMVRLHACASASGARSFAVRAAQSGATYQVLADGELLVDGEAMAPALIQLGGHLMIHVAEYAPEFVFVHAGVVAWQGRALLLPGVSHAGKSTLVAELVRAGATYYSDEFALLDSHGRVHPFARDLRIRRPGKPDQTSVPVTHLKGRAGTQALHRRDDRLHRIRAGCLLGSATGVPWQSRAGNAAAYRARAANPGAGPGHCFRYGAKCRRLEVFARRSRSGCAGPHRCPGRGRSAGMRPGMHLLLALLRGEASAGDGSAEQWGAALDIARQENILPWTAARLRSIPGALPPGLDARLRQIHRDAQVSAFFWTSTLRTLLADFHERGIPVVSLKGPWMAERLCGDAALRPCTDLDLLVRPVDLARSEALLSQLRLCAQASPRRSRAALVSRDCHGGFASRRRASAGIRLRYKACLGANPSVGLSGCPGPASGARRRAALSLPSQRAPPLRAPQPHPRSHLCFSEAPAALCRQRFAARP